MSLSFENENNLIESIKSGLKCRSDDPNGATYQSLRKLNGQHLLKAGCATEAAYNFVEALAPSVRTMARFRAERTAYQNKDDKQKLLKAFSHKLNNKSYQPPKSEDFLQFLHNETQWIESGKGIQSETVENFYRTSDHLNISHVKHSHTDSVAIENMKNMLNELPDEWTIIQLTAGYEPTEQWQSLNGVKSNVNKFYISILKSLNLNKEEPLTVEILPEPVKYDEKPLFEELHLTLKENLNVIENNAKYTSKSVAKYWEKRNDCDLRMKSVIETMDKKWLAQWRCLFLGRIKSSEIEKLLHEYLEEICSTLQSTLTPHQKFLLLCLINACNYISPTGASLLLHKIYFEYAQETNEKCITCHSNIIEKLCVSCDVKKISSSSEYKLFRKTFLNAMEEIKYGSKFKGFRSTPRYPIIFLIDEKLDTFPWEVLPILTNNPVTRIECLNIAYALFKNHKDNIKHGYYQLKPNIGNYLINPGGDLVKMEKRMSCFIDYWCPKWIGEKNTKPSPDLYEKYLQNSDIFLYCGHGDGSHYIGNSSERLSGIKSVSILSGCGSVCLRYPGPRFLPVSIHSHIHIANGPSVIGMLWEVTDLEVDKVTSMLLSLFVPSQASKPWSEVNKSRWTQGVIGLDDTDESKEQNCEHQPDLLCALAAARNSSSFIMIAASVVSRGLPVYILQ